jgi:hypothetical protein
MRNLSKKEAINIQAGSSIKATGGGGSFESGVEAINLCYDQNQAISLLRMDQIEPEKYYISVGIIGDLSEESAIPIDQEIDLMMNAVISLERHLEVEFHGIVSPEFGGMTGVAMAGACLLGKPIVDCDTAGRAVPSMEHSTFNIMGIDSSPLSVVSKFGDSVIIEKTKDAERLEQLLRSMAVASGCVANTFNPIKGKLLGETTINHALSDCEKIGKARQDSLDKGKDPIESILNSSNGYKLFYGVVKETEVKNQGGYTEGVIHIDGMDQFEGDVFKLWFKNEHLISWKNGESFVTCPDLLTVMDPIKGMAISNPNCKADDQVCVLGFKSDAIWRTNRGIELLSPRSFGYEINFTPIEDIEGIV